MKCDMCSEIIEEFRPRRLGRKIFCLRCYQIALIRLDKFVDILTLPEDEFEKLIGQKHLCQK